MNASGRSASGITLDRVLSDIPPAERKHDRVPMTSAHAVTVPGAAAGWIDVLDTYGNGKLSLKEILAPAIELAEEGFPVSELAAGFWKDGEEQLKEASPNFDEMLKNGRAPKIGEIMRLKALASTFRDLATHGKKGFYEGRVAEEIVKAVQDRGGVLSLKDLEEHGKIGSEQLDPISLEIPWGETAEGKKTVWECEY